MQLMRNNPEFHLGPSPAPTLWDVERVLTYYIPVCREIINEAREKNQWKTN